MKNGLFLLRGNKGAALIAVVLTITLVTALFVMAFTNGVIGRVVGQTHVNRRLDAQCAQGALHIGRQIIDQVAVGDPSVFPIDATLSGEVRLPTGNDSVIMPLVGNPDITIPAVVGGCGVITVDVDNLFKDSVSGGSSNDMNEYHDTTGGAYCPEGDFYSVTAVTQRGGGPSVAAYGAFFKCR